MGGGLMQLVAYGAQDVYLTGNPQITFFKVVYRRHTNFACEAIEQTFNGTPAFGGKATVPITRNGDLVTKMWLHTTVKNTTAGDADMLLEPGNSMIKSVELQIGGTKIDKHYGKWMHLWSDLSRSVNQDVNYTAMVGDGAATLAASTGELELFIPLQFFCCRNDGLALPLIALQYHDVRLEFEFEDADRFSDKTTGVTLNNTTLLVNYIYLDSEERKRFAQASHEYLIEQLQFTGVETAISGANKFRLNFNHPVKELVWVHKTAGTALGNNISITDALLQLNGHDRFSKQSGRFFENVQPNIHHTRAPSSGVNVYSFALKPEDHQPSGTCNFSRIDNATLSVTTTAGGEVYIYGVNYNVLRVMSGMGGVAYSN
jgi:hypothetical protein